MATSGSEVEFQHWMAVRQPKCLKRHKRAVCSAAGGAGVKGVRGGGVGDLIVKLVVETPGRLNSSRQKQLLRDFEGHVVAAAGKHKPKSEGFFSGVKNFFDDLTK